MLKLKMSDSTIFREKRTYPEGSFENQQNKYSALTNKTHDAGIARAREYSLSSVLHFTKHSGIDIKHLIETDFDYFLWLPMNIENFTYTKEVYGYAKNCLKYLNNFEKEEEFGNQKMQYTIDQINIMIQYEYELDFGDDKNLLEAYKSMINVPFYKLIEKSNERLIRQAIEVKQLSNEYRNQYFEKIYKSSI